MPVKLKDGDDEKARQQNAKKTNPPYENPRNQSYSNFMKQSDSNQEGAAKAPEAKKTGAAARIDLAVVPVKNRNPAPYDPEAREESTYGPVFADMRAERKKGLAPDGLPDLKNVQIPPHVRKTAPAAVKKVLEEFYSKESEIPRYDILWNRLESGAPIGFAGLLFTNINEKPTEYGTGEYSALATKLAKNPSVANNKNVQRNLRGIMRELENELNTEVPKARGHEDEARQAICEKYQKFALEHFEELEGAAPSMRKSTVARK